MNEKIYNGEVWFEYIRSNTVMAELYIYGKDTLRYKAPVKTQKTKKMSRGFRFNAEYLEEVCRTNHVDYQHLKILNPEPITWYACEDGLGSRTLSWKFLTDWMNFDCPTMYKCRTAAANDPEKDPDGNEPYTREMLIEIRYDSPKISDTATEEEVAKFEAIAGTSGRVYEAVRIWKWLRNISPFEVMDASRRVEAYEARIDRVIEAHQDELISCIRENEPKQDTLDCGWINFYTRDDAMQKDYKLLEVAGKRFSTRVKIQFPYMSQSTTAQGAGAELLCRILRDEEDIHLYASSWLD